ncbi:hypothetical protein [uncultured Alistipes sp.]|jgi:hypothetical protein|uniref:hypothetical protein n=1 Tax=uncultured Alistipes sp. TaxID=538949 RepID=UPI00259649AD|nr:hypothetical protein [uncultured Alistipes sp.]
MKKILLVAMLLICSIALHAQNDVTRFLGIPVDGTKYEMIQKLKAKGFQSTPFDKDVLTGEFNGTDVNIYVVTTNNKVSRIMVADVNIMDETDIKIRFNKLCRQFQKNKKYLPASLSVEDYSLSDDENISYEMLVHKKRYEAAYCQLPPTVVDSVSIRKEIMSVLFSKYSEEQLVNASEESRKEMIMAVLADLLGRYSKKSVWFMISDYYGKYYITMFYDNEYNRANGEDL